MASKKGIVMTAVILGAITAASFMVWVLPHDTEQTISVSDFANHLDGVQSIHMVLSEELDNSFASMQADQITTEQYIEMAEAASGQVNMQIIELVESRAPEQWHQSYISYIDALKTQNTIIRETIVAANLISEGDLDGFDETMSKIESLRDEMNSYVQSSAQSTP